MAKNALLFLTQAGNLSASTLATSGTAFTPGTEGSKLSLLKISAVNSSPVGGTISVGGVALYTYPGAMAAEDDILTLIDAPLDKNGNRYFNLENGDTVTFSGVTGGTVQIAAYGEDY